MRNLRRIAAAALAFLPAGCKDEIGDGRTVRQLALALQAPSNLAGTPQAGGTIVALSWTDNSTGEESYALEMHDAPFDTGFVRDRVILPADATSYDYPSGPGTLYYFRVFAMTSTLQSDFSNILSITTPNPPPAPFGLTATAASSSRIDLAWGDTPTETSYRLERSLDGGATWSARATLAADTVVHSDSGLAADTEYCYRVFATNTDGDSLPSNTACAVTETASMTITTALSPGLVGRYTSIAVTAAGTEFVAHYDATNTNVLHTSGAAGGPYGTLTIDAGPTGTQNVGDSEGISIALDAGGFSHVAAWDATNRDLRYATNAGGSFVATTIESAGDVGRTPRIEVSPAGDSIQILHVESVSGSQNNLRRAVFASGSWTFEPVFSGEWIPYLSFAIDSAGNPHVSFLNVTGGGAEYRLMHGSKTGGAAWAFTEVDASAGFKQSSIAIDPSGFPHVVFNGRLTPSSPEALLHATNASGAWTVEAAHEDPSGFAVLGRHNSIAIDSSTGRIHVAYHDATQADLRYARKDPGGAWVRRLIDSGGSVGTETGIAVDGSGAVHISYHDATNGDLKIASGAP